MSKNKDKLNSSSNTLFNYFSKSPATPKIKPASTASNPGTPVSSSAGTPKGIKKEKESPAPAAKEKVVVGGADGDDGDEDEIQPVKKRRRIVMMDDDDEDEYGGDSDSENRVRNDKTPPKVELSSFKRPDKEDAVDSPVQKKVKVERESSRDEKEDLADLGDGGDDKTASVLDEPTVWAHQKLDFLKPEKIKDIQGNRPGSEKYDSRTLFVPESFLNTLTPVS